MESAMTEAARTSTTMRRRTKSTNEFATVEMVDALNSRIGRRSAEHNARLVSICDTLERILDMVAPEPASASRLRPDLRVVGGTEARAMDNSVPTSRRSVNKSLGALSFVPFAPAPAVAAVDPHRGWLNEVDTCIAERERIFAGCATVHEECAAE